MAAFLILLLILSLYPILKLVLYIPIYALMKNKKNRKGISLILTALMTVILLIILLTAAYLTLGYSMTNDWNILDSGPALFTFLGFTYVLGLFAAVVLLVLKFINAGSKGTAEDSSGNIKKNNIISFENIILTLVIGGFAALILLIFYSSWS